MGIVLGPGGGALAKMATPFRLGVGGRLGDGQQWMPWIQMQDLARMIAFLLKESTVRGVFNAVSPHPVRNSEFTRALATALHRPAVFPVPVFALKLLFGEMAEALLASCRATPDAITRALGNLLDNAAAATLAGGLVRVTVRADDDVAAVAVFDSGRGVPAGDEERIFDRFVRVGPDASRSTSGSGLGLPIARAIARSHGGDVRCVATAVGSCFELTLPLVSRAWSPNPNSVAAGVQP